MEFYFQIKDNVNRNYYNGRNINGIVWTNDIGKRYNNISCCHNDAISILKHSIGMPSVIIIKRYKVNTKWFENVLKVVKLHEQNKNKLQFNIF